MWSVLQQLHWCEVSEPICLELVVRVSPCEMFTKLSLTGPCAAHALLIVHIKLPIDKKPNLRYCLLWDVVACASDLHPLQTVLGAKQNWSEIWRVMDG